uniref:NADAR domain-containing protein n=1 Tax=Panagrellus redivivus TaxID=6233 RepID=A0A7E4UTT6_PANRE
MNLAFDKASIADITVSLQQQLAPSAQNHASFETPKMVTSTDGHSLALFYDTVFSNFYPCEIYTEGIKFTCSEQYFMYKKALFFNDPQTAKKILEAKNPMTMKLLGRQVKNFDENKWKLVAMQVMKRACYFKFDQNDDLRGELFKTAGSTLVEASPTDTIWGVGLGEDDKRICDVKQWRGRNQLGYLLTALREELMRVYGIRHVRAA